MGEFLMNTPYLAEAKRAMKMLADDPRTIFVGQAVEYDGQAMHSTLEFVPAEKRLEMPVIEDFQMGFCTGLALEGYVPICIFPRFDFLICATNQLVNHLDTIPLVSNFKPKVIIRTSVGATKPLNPGPQHSRNHTEGFKKMLATVNVVELTEPNDIFQAYTDALQAPQSTLLVEYGEKYIR